MNKRYKHTTTNTTVSIFYEQYSLGKYFFEAPYQRDYNVWDMRQKSFLIDTIFKNFPMPPVFLEQKIINGKTTYDVIDGKQRLNTIINFINNEVPLPLDFGNDEYGYAKLNGKKFDEIRELANKDSIIQDYVDEFWSYIINIVYIERPSDKIVDNIFDRLNRGGERLNSAELRKAKYYDTIIYKGICRVAKCEHINQLLFALDHIRLEDISFLTEVYILVLTKKIEGGTESNIDKSFKNNIDKVDLAKNDEIISKIEYLALTIKRLNIDLIEYSISGTSHLYALFYLAYYLMMHEISVTEALQDKIKNFYIDLRSTKENSNVKLYSESMQSASKSKSSRVKRINALLNYLGFNSITLM